MATRLTSLHRLSNSLTSKDLYSIGSLSLSTTVLTKLHDAQISLCSESIIKQYFITIIIIIIIIGPIIQTWAALFQKHNNLGHHSNVFHKKPSRDHEKGIKPCSISKTQPAISGKTHVSGV